MSTADDTAPAPALSDGPPLDAAQRLGLARFRLGPDAPPWLMETLAFARDEFARLTRERDEARAALREGQRCGDCGIAATQCYADKSGVVDFACDSCRAANEGDSWRWADLPHAAAVRAAQVPA